MLKLKIHFMLLIFIDSCRLGCLHMLKLPEYTNMLRCLAWLYYNILKEKFTFEIAL